MTSVACQQVHQIGSCEMIYYSTANIGGITNRRVLVDVGVGVEGRRHLEVRVIVAVRIERTKEK